MHRIAWVDRKVMQKRNHIRSVRLYVIEVCDLLFFKLMAAFINNLKVRMFYQLWLWYEDIYKMNNLSIVFYCTTAASFSLAFAFSRIGWVRTGGLSRTFALCIFPINSTCTSSPGVSNIRGIYANTSPFPVAGL